ncbi:MAG: metalloregulator ArsR/SmtB family transcription factor [Myxococcota bacterium]|nr:metalloregulator ArsR/SmtB family transcription factor [Myxococcota bacterium]
MATPRTRPEGCCPLEPVAPLSAARQAGVVRLFKALADPTRLEIVRLLRGQPGATCVCDIVGHFDLAQPTISHHLKVLREAGLVEQAKIGIWSFYELDPEGARLLDEAEALLAS